MAEPANSYGSFLSTLQTSLDNREWTKVKQQLTNAPSSLPEKASSTEIASTFDITRGVADALIEACSYDTAFEKSFETKRALHRAGACDWALRTLRGFAGFQPIVSRVSSVLGVLGTVGVEGRGIIGSIGAVDQLTKLWHKHPSCVEIVSALVSLCAGHIDNVSRAMRQRGLVVAMDVLVDARWEENPVLYEQTLLFIGYCAICIPDNRAEGNRLVPVLIDVLERLKETKLLQIARHAISAVAIICDCWMKELNGYCISDPPRLVAAIVSIWTTCRPSLDITSAASWALLSLMAVREDARAAISRHAIEIQPVANRWQSRSSTCRSLLQAITEMRDGASTSPSEALSDERGDISSPIEPAPEISSVEKALLSEEPGLEEPGVEEHDVEEHDVEEHDVEEPSVEEPEVESVPDVGEEVVEVTPVQSNEKSQLTPKRKRQRERLAQLLLDDESGLDVPLDHMRPKKPRKRSRRSYRLPWDLPDPLAEVKAPEQDASHPTRKTTKRAKGGTKQPSEDVIVISDSEEDVPIASYATRSWPAGKQESANTKSPTGVQYVADDSIRRSGRKRTISFKYSARSS